MKFLKYLWRFFGTVDPKREVEKEMSKKYGADWLDKCCDALKDPEVREGVAKTLKLTTKNN